jgi:hypothetical protein
MLKLVAVSAVLAVLGWVYWAQLRPRLRTQPELKAFYDRMDAINASLWERVLARLEGWKTVILGVLGTVWMLAPEVLQQLVGVTWTELGLSEAWAHIIGAGLYVAMIMTRVAGGGLSGEPK